MIILSNQWGETHHFKEFFSVMIEEYLKLAMRQLANIQAGKADFPLYHPSFHKPFHIKGKKS